MNIDKPQCNLKTCRYCHDHNCFSADYERCEYTLAKRTPGEWKAKTFHHCYCTNCDFVFDIMKCDFMGDMNYCPKCGAPKSANDRQVTGKLNEETKDSHAEYWNSIGEYKEGEQND